MGPDLNLLCLPDVVPLSISYCYANLPTLKRRYNNIGIYSLSHLNQHCNNVGITLSSTWVGYNPVIVSESVRPQKLQVTYNFKSIIDMAFKFHPETHWVKIYVLVAHDLDLTFLTYLKRSFSKKL